MKRTIFLGGLALGLAVGAEARDWGFDKDTVYTSNPGGDTVWLVNGRTDTLKLDSVSAENINVSSTWGLNFQYQPGSSSAQLYQINQFNPSRAMTGVVIPSGDSVLFGSFMIGTPCPTAKITGFSATTDSIMIRLRFKAAFAEQDSLVVKGSYCSVSILKPSGQSHQFNDWNIEARDVLGRKIIPSGNPLILKRILE